MLIAAAVLVLASCARIETNDRPGTTKPPVIGFSSYTPTSLTRANDTFIDGTALASGKQFAVYAWQTDYGTFLPVNPGVPAFMNPAVVTWNGDANSGSGNTYSPTRYWPSGDEPANLSFTAYYPYGGAGITPPTFGSGDDPFVPSGVGTYAFSAAGTPAAMVDFCVADVVNDQVYGNTNAGSSYKQTVKFSFHHMLTKVQFRFKTNNTDTNTEVKLVEAQLKNIKTTGTLKASFAQHLEETPADPDNPAVDLGVNKLGTTSMEWDDQAIAASPVVYDITLNNSDPTAGTNEIAANEILLETTPNTVHRNDIFLMIPQEMVEPTFDSGTGALSNTPQYLEVTWKVTTDGVTTTNTKKLYLDDCTLYTSSVNPEALADNDWTMNSAITYTITIGPQPIYFTGTATNWAAEQNGYFNP